LQGEGKECKEKIHCKERKFHQKRWSMASDEAKLLIPMTSAGDPSQRNAAKEALNGAWMTMVEERTQPKKLAFKLEFCFTS
jgi:1,2-phenylacetyl-CoA epoxidase catalytic subunit